MCEDALSIKGPRLQKRIAIAWLTAGGYMREVNAVIYRDTRTYARKNLIAVASVLISSETIKTM